MQSSNSEDSVEIFCSYSHRDEPLREQFESSVAVLRRQNLVQVWHDRQIVAGDKWAGQIDEHLDRADIITLFVSADFLASDYCWNIELNRALQRQESGQAVVVPIIVRACDWSEAPFAHLQGIPTGAVPVTSWPNRDEAWTAVAKSLKGTVRTVLTRKLENLKKCALVRASTLRPTIDVEAFRAVADTINASAMEARKAENEKKEREKMMAFLKSKIFSLTEELGPEPARPRKRAEDAFSTMKKYVED